MCSHGERFAGVRRRSLSKQICSDLGKRVGLHTLRHAAASRMLANGAAHTISKILGHSSIVITGDVYGHVTTEDACSALDLLTPAVGSP